MLALVLNVIQVRDNIYRQKVHATLNLKICVPYQRDDSETAYRF